MTGRSQRILDDLKARQRAGEYMVGSIPNSV